MKAEIFTIRALTNLHVGSGDENYGVVDNQVQRDPVTELPIINSSSLKGALREFFDHKNSNEINNIFGSNNNAGRFAFLSAQMLFRPVRSNTKPYFMATTKEIVDNFLKDLERYKIIFSEKSEYEKIKNATSGDVSVIDKATNIIIEDDITANLNIQLNISKIIKSEELALFTCSKFKELDLPVIARNHLENGISQNLWYEEVVPKETIFYFTVIYDEKDENSMIEFKKLIQSEPVQIGANASIGYGLCEIKELV